MMRLLVGEFITFLFIFCCNCDANGVYKYVVKTHDGKEVSLQDYSGKVTLIVNVASYCSYTESMYRALTRIHDILGNDGYFSVLAFPCNQFGEQEPNDASYVYTSMLEQYAIEFPIFDKVDAIGANASPLFKDLIEKSSVAPDWNFYKYLVDHNGEVLNAWGTSVTIEEIFDEVDHAIKRAKKAKSAGDIPTKSPDMTEEKVTKEEL